VSIYSNPRGSAAANARMVVQALLDLLGDRPPLEVLAETPGRLEAVLAGVPPGELARPEAPDRWSAAMVVAHLADTELVIGVRGRFIVGDPGSPLVGFDQDAWAREFRYEAIDIAESMTLFRTVRAANLRFWRGHTPEQWQRTGHHTERGPTSADLNLRISAGHDLVHRRQIARILGITDV
jgi:hypothetical protein